MIYFSLLIRELRFFTNFRNKTYQFLLLFNPFFMLTIIYFLQQVREGVTPGKFVIASALVSMWTYVLYSSGSSLVNLKWNDTLKLVIASPISLFSVITMKTISNSIIAIISVVLCFLYGKYIFQFSIELSNVWIFSISLLVFTFSLSVMGLILSITFVASQNVFDFQNLIQIPLILLSGVFTSIQEFPTLLEWFSYLIPMTWGIKLVYGSITPNSLSHLLTIGLISIFISLLYLFLAYILIKIMEKTLRNNGTWGLI